MSGRPGTKVRDGGAPRPDTGSVRLAKLHGLGNDFLVRVGGGVDAAMARALCDRRRGVGADGLIGLEEVGGELRMTLFNADGSRAEISGNGIRCAAQALARRRGVADLEVTVVTDAGPRLLEVRPGPSPREVSVRVDMGVVTIGRLDAGEAEVDTGNPHLVLLVDDTAAVDLLELGRRHPDLNVEVVAPAGPDTLALRVHERGAGVTEACGSGSCAAAAAAAAWGVVGRSVVVRNPGGDLTVELEHDRALLTGPSVFVADVEVPWP